jgi:MarR family transcriptional regulator, organic hydroperoxide resistance regulator
MNKAPRRATGKADHLRLDQQLCFPLYAASRLVTRLYQPLLEPLGLTYPQYVVLMILWEDAPCSVSHVGARALLNTNTLTPLLKRLEQLGYVRRTRNSADERVVSITLTGAGAALKTRCASIPESLHAAVDYPFEKAAALKRSLEELILTLQAQGIAASAA